MSELLSINRKTANAPGVGSMRFVRRMGVFWNKRLPKLATRRMRIYGTICRMNGRLRYLKTDDEIMWWHRNSGRLIDLDNKWFPRVKTKKPPNNKVSHSAGRTPESEGMK